ncbi:MAG: helix-turn-helix transcriptional regulator [Clostridia bacterium]|nr:helix-turn-helix transcriptional regulator [Clostridia bacterium]MBQ6121529.1 helix-turn-helix transcriptional regulator [Clostridia bacterium]
MTMGERIRILREQSGLTMEQLGERIGVQKSAIKKYENGTVENIKRSTIKTMASIFGVSPSYLMFGEEIEEKTAPAIKPDPERENVIRLFAALTEENQRRLLDYAELLLQAQQVGRDSHQ